MRLRIFCITLLLLACPFPALAAEKKPFELKDGDRVVLVGNTFVEREGEDGYLETLLTTRFPARDVTFRNLGWGGDTVDVQARPPTYKDLKHWVGFAKPTVVFVSYGMMESFAGAAGLPGYVKAYERMLDMLAGTKARIVVLSPVRHEALGGRRPDPTAHNKNLRLYIDATKKLADKKGYPFVDLHELLGDGAKATPRGPLTDNGIHLNPYGYWRAAAAVEEALGHPARGWHVAIDATGGAKARAEGTKLTDVRAAATGVRFQAADELLPPPPLPPEAPAGFAPAKGKRTVQVQGLKPGRYALKVDGKAVAAGAAADWAKGVTVTAGPEFEQVEKLRGLVVRKNDNFFWRYRPMNWEYILGHRNGNQKGLYEELSQFDPIIEKAEQEIAKLRKPTSHTYELVREDKPEPAAKPAKDGPKEIKWPLKRKPGAPDPEAERQAFQLPEGWEATLWCADPILDKPISMSFDAQGRLWVACTHHYPHIAPGLTNDDKILILEDRKNTGRADTYQVFSDKMLIPVGVLPAKGGAYVFHDTRVVFLKDTDGDGKADRRRVVLSGFGTEDSHHMGHTFRWSPGGNFHFNQGIFLHTAVETPHGLVRTFRGKTPHAAVFRYRPETELLDYFVAHSGPPNPWGHYIDRWGRSYYMDSSGRGGSQFILPTAAGTASHLPVPGGDGKVCGGVILSGRHIPKEFQGNLLINHFMVSRIERFAWAEEGSGYVQKKLPSFLVSKDPKFRPVDIAMGPDGAIYVADWFNPLIGHMQHHLRDPKRDMSHGRIWKITYKKNKLLPKPKLVGAPAKDVLDALKAPEDYTRYQARRALVERDDRKEVLAALAAWVKGLDEADADYDHHRLEALWVYQSLDVVEPALLKSLLRAKEPNARAAATAVLRDWRDRVERPLELLGALVVDEHPRVRLEAVIALSYFPSVRAMELAALAVDRPMDQFLTKALRQTAQALQPQWLPELEAGKLTFGGNARRLEFVLTAAGSRGVVKPLLSLLKAGKVPAENRANAVAVVAAVGNAGELGQLWEWAAGSGDARLHVRALAELRRASREREVNPKVDLKRLKGLLGGKDEGLRLEAIRLAGAWKAEGVRGELAELAWGKDTRAPARQAAVESLVALGGAKSAAVFRELSDADRPIAQRVLGVAGLAAVGDEAAAGRGAEVLTSPAADTADLSELFAAFLQRKGGADLLAGALAKKKVSADVAKLGLRYMYSVGRQDPELEKLFKKAAAVATRVEKLTPAELKKLMKEVESKGDAARGEVVFRRKDLSCLNCHAVNGAGGRVGPDISLVGGATGTASGLDYLIESILLPSKVIKEGYETVVVTTRDGRQFHGIKVREDKSRLVLRDAVKDEILIPVKRIEERKAGPSLMPTGLADSLTRAEFLDLVAFLAQLGRPGPFAANPTAPLVRRWRVLEPVPEGLAALKAEEVQAGDLDSNLLPWSFAYGTVGGVLPLADLPKTKEGVSFAQAEVDMARGGKVTLKVNAAKGLALWVDGKRVALKEKTELDLGAGRRRLTFRVDHEARGKDGLRAEFAEVAGSDARLTVVASSR